MVSQFFLKIKSCHKHKCLDEFFSFGFTNNVIVSFQCATANPNGQKRALVIGGGIANFTDVAATFNGIIRALKEKVSLVSFKNNFQFVSVL